MYYNIIYIISKCNKYNTWKVCKLGDFQIAVGGIRGLK